jgi:uncharacterized protein (DUF305 family)
MNSAQVAQLLGFISLAMAAACASGSGTASQATASVQPVSSSAEAIARARADSARHPYTDTDIRFMSGMIGHHSQAIVMARLAPSRDAGPSVRTLCERIINAQQDEITIASQWLRDRLQPVPDASSHGHHAHMPGMLSDVQMKQLEESRGIEFDRLFLLYMIQHHQGAITMVKELFDTWGAAQDQTIFKFATDVNVDQATEIARMQKMLAAMSHLPQ